MIDPALSRFIPLDTILDAVATAVELAEPEVPTLGTIAKTVGAEWGCSERTRAAVIKLALEWAQCAARPAYIEVNRDTLCTRHPRSTVAGEAVYSQEPPER